MKQLVVIMGMLPPPVTGAAKNTALMVEETKATGAQVIAISTSCGDHALLRSTSYHFRRVAHAFQTLGRLRAAARVPAMSRTLYLVPDGGLGLIYTYLYLRFGANDFSRIFIHHRTSAYVEVKSPWMSKIVELLCDRAVHIFLSDGQRSSFEEKYQSQKSIVSTNGLYVVPRNPRKNSEVITLGHLSNLCELKGFYDVVETFENAIDLGLPVNLKIAGPVVEPGVQDVLNRLNEQYPNQVEFFGPLSGDAKDKFYDLIDVFLFPTRWPQEAQPNVVYEAFAGGAYNIAFGRGSIPEMIPTVFGLTVPVGDNFALAAVAYLKTFWQNDRDPAVRTSKVYEWMLTEVELSKKQRKLMMDAISADS